MTAVSDVPAAEVSPEALHLQIIRTATRLKLDIGAGKYPRAEDFVTLDAHTPADIRGEMWEINLPDESVDEIWSSHALEHIQMGQIHETLVEWRRILRLGGKAIILVPNFDYVAKYWLCGNQGQRDASWAEQLIFGQQTHPGEFHKSAFTAGSIKADLTAAGFTVERVEFKWTHNQETLQAVALKEK